MKFLQYALPLLVALPWATCSPLAAPSPIEEAPRELSARDDELKFGGIRMYTSRSENINRFRILGGLRILAPAFESVFQEGGRGVELARAFFGDFVDSTIDMFSDVKSFQAIYKQAVTEGASVIGFQWESGSSPDAVLEDVKDYFFHNNMVPVSRWDVEDAFKAGGSLELGKRSEGLDKREEDPGATCARYDMVSLFRPWIEWDEDAPLYATAC